MHINSGNVKRKYNTYDDQNSTYKFTNNKFFLEVIYYYSYDQL